LCIYLHWSVVNVVVIYTCLVVIALLAHRIIIDRSAYMDPSGHYSFWPKAATHRKMTTTTYQGDRRFQAIFHVN